MLETLLIRLGETPEAPVDFALIDARGELLTQVQRAPLSDLKTQAVDRTLVALLPGDQVTLAQVEMPTRNRQRLRKAVPFAMEEQLNDDIDSLHFALGEPAEDGRVPVAVVARERMRAWSEAFAAAGLDVRHFYPASQAVPRPPVGWTLVLDEPLCLLRSAKDESLCIDAELLDWTLQRIADPEHSLPVTCYHTREQSLPDFPAGLELDREETVSSALAVLAKGVCTGEAIELLQGDFARKAAYAKVWQSWRAAAVMAGLVLLLAFISQGVALSTLSRQQADLQAGIEAVYQQAFPKAKRIVNPVFQMKDKLSSLHQQQGSAGGDFLTLLALSGAALSESGLTLQGISFRDGALDLSVTAGDVQSIDQLKTRLGEDQRLQVEIQSASAKDGKVQGRVRIRGAQS